MMMRKRLASVLIAVVMVMSMALPILASTIPRTPDSPVSTDAIVGYDDLGRPIHRLTVTASYTSSTNDCDLLGVALAYLTAQQQGVATYLFTGTYNGFVGQSIYYDGNYWYNIDRTGLYFNTSALPSGVTITSANLSLYVLADYSATNFNIQVQSGGSTYPSSPPITSDYNKGFYSGNGGQLSTVGLVASAYNTLPLNATGISWLVPGGTTKFMLRSDRDIAGTSPVGYGQDEVVQLGTYQHGVGYWPQLIIDYTYTAPTIVASAASTVATNSAQLNSLITAGGGSTNCSVRFGFGTTSQTAGNFTSYDNLTGWVAGYAEGNTPYVTAEPLAGGTTYYFRVQVSNDNSTATSANELSFTTTGGIAPVSILFAYPAVESISLNWALPSGASQVLIRSRTDTYPTTTADGTLVVLSAIGTYDYTGLTAGTTYYFSAWGEASGNYSSSYKTLVVTTQGTTNQVSGGETIPAPSVPTDWGQTPDASGLSHLQPIYDAVNGVLTEMGIPNGNGWMILAYFIIAIAGVILLVKTRSAFGTVMVVFVLMAGASAVHIIPGWSMLLLLPFAAGSWALERTFL